VSEQDGGDPAQRAVVAEHRLLSSLFAEAITALEKEDEGRRARTALARLNDGMEAHFQREESLYYPTIWTLRPDLRGSLAGLVQTHPQFRERLDAIAAAVEATSFAKAGRDLEELAGLFSDHERAEELLLQSLAVELDTTA
jgi:hypothetical protein